MSEWSQHIDQVAGQVVRIETQDMWGTGFVHYATDGGVRCIVSARDVLEQPLRDSQRFRVWHGSRVSEFGSSLAQRGLDMDGSTRSTTEKRNG